MLAAVFKIYYFHDSFTFLREDCKESLTEWFLMENLDWEMPVSPTSPHSVSLFSYQAMETFIRDLCCFRVYLLYLVLSGVSPVSVMVERTCDSRCAKSIRNRLVAT